MKTIFPVVPAALAVLMGGWAGSGRAALDFASLNGALGDNERTLQVLDLLPEGDARRRAMAGRAFDLLLAAKRYHDAAVAVPLPEMLQQLERNVAAMERMAALPRPAGRPDPYPAYVVRTTLKHIEVLAGSGQVAVARQLAAKALEIDGAKGTRDQLRQALVRAGQPALADELAGKHPP